MASGAAADRRGWAIALVLALCSGCRPVAPPALARLESASARAYEHALAGDRDVTSQSTREAIAAWRELQPILQRDGAPACELASLDERVATLQSASPKDAAEHARAANALHAETSDAFRRYQAFTLARLIELGSHGREIVLDADASEWRAADAAFAALARDWARLKPCAQTADPAGSTGFDACLAELARPLEARDAAQVIHGAKACLAEVELLRRVLVP